jgi:peptide methionine sulfoxide reductase MsrA
MRTLVLALLVIAGCAREDLPDPSAAPSRPMLQPVPANLEVAILAGGCFWGMEELLRKIPGVIDTEAGYAAGAESVRVVFDPAKLPYATLLERWYFRMHDPTTKDRQGNDVGDQYRSAIFYTTEAQRTTATQIKARVEASGFWKAPIVTQIVAAGEFKPAESSHQDYLQKHPDGYTCHYIRH